MSVIASYYGNMNGSTYAVQRLKMNMYMYCIILWKHEWLDLVLALKDAHVV